MKKERQNISGKKKTLRILLLLVLIGIIFVFGLNTVVCLSVSERIDEKTEEKADAILVLGAAIWADGPCPMLRDRLDKAIELYQQQAAPVLLMSGDSSQPPYDEVGAMKDYAVEHGVPEEDIVLDPGGIRTYDSMYRAESLYGVKKVIVVTQKYHLFRALYIGQKLGLETIGVHADPTRYSGAVFREIREVLARDKDFFGSLFRVQPTYTEDIKSTTR